MMKKTKIANFLIIIFLISFSSNLFADNHIGGGSLITPDEDIQPEPTQEELNEINEAVTRYVNGIATEEDIKLLEEKGVKVSVLPVETNNEAETTTINQPENNMEQVSEPIPQREQETDNSGQFLINSILIIGMIVLFYLFYRQKNR